MAAQSFKKHAKIPPGYLALMVLNVTLCSTAFVHLGHSFDALHLMLAGLALAVTANTLRSRRSALANQDRVIRLEENVRLHNLGVDPSGLTLRQMIALRFAPDAEVVALARRAVAERMSPVQIKAAIVAWRADHNRV